VTPEVFGKKSAALEARLRPLFKQLQPRLGFGEMNFDIFYTTMIRSRKIPRPEKPTSDLPEAIAFMIRCLRRKRVIT
jgi:hypothetical protein